MKFDKIETTFKLYVINKHFYSVIGTSSTTTTSVAFSNCCSKPNI